MRDEDGPSMSYSNESEHVDIFLASRRRGNHDDGHSQARRSFTMMRLFSLLLCVLLFAKSVSACLEENCRSRGFDPQQLSCDTCNALPDHLKSSCLECCQTYKTLHGQPQRYGYAVLVYNAQNEEMAKFIDESLKQVHHTKGSHRLQAVESPGGMYGMMPSTIFWMESSPQNVNGQSLDYKLRLYQGMAKEQVTVEGWRKEDLEDMLLTLLEDA